MQQSEYYPYPPRPGIGLEALNFNAEQSVLPDSEYQQVVEFEHNLYDLSLDADSFPIATQYQAELAATGESLQPLEHTWDLKVNSSQLGVNYFMTEAGASALQETFGIDAQFKTSQEAKHALASLDTGSIDSKILDKLEADSVGYEETQLVEMFTANNFSGEGLPAIDLITVYKNPEVLATKAQSYRQLKTYLGQVKTDLEAAKNDTNTGVVDAQLLLVKKYQQRVNKFLASTYVSAHELLAQYRASGETIHGDTLKKLQDVLPAFSMERDNAPVASFLQRIDRYRRGVGLDENDKFTWLSSPASKLAQSTDTSESVPVDRDIYEDIDLETLESTSIEGEEFGKLLKGVLEEYGMLSVDTKWSSERSGPANDNKWQVIIDAKFKSLAVNDKQRIVKVSAKPIKLLTAISVGNHEITHVLQHENKRALGELAILQRVGLDDVSEQTEAGGMWQEKVAYQALTGKTRHQVAGMGYYENLKVKASGGTFGECVQTYYDSLKQGNPSIANSAAAAQAVNRARRVFRFGGLEYAQDTEYVTNSQPLSYLEQRLIFEGLTDETRKYLLVGGISIANLVELGQSGLIDTNKINIPDKMPWQVMYPAVKELIASADR